MQTIAVQHINADHEDLLGNDNIGRYVFLTGSDQRAHDISTHFNHVVVKKHPRQHNLYLGTLLNQTGDIEVAAISTGMGGPSADIIINELFLLGAKRMLRVGTAGSLQPERIKAGDIVIATAAVRDDKTSWDYIYKEYPAIASLECVLAAQRAVETLSFNDKTHCGIVHSKSSLFAREMSLSLLENNKHYMNAMHLSGVLATEMECAQLFILSSLLNSQLIQAASHDYTPILSGAILAIIGDQKPFSANKKVREATINNAIELSLETIKQLHVFGAKYSNAKKKSGYEVNVVL